MWGHNGEAGLQQEVGVDHAQVEGAIAQGVNGRRQIGIHSAGPGGGVVLFGGLGGPAERFKRPHAAPDQFTDDLPDQ